MKSFMHKIEITTQKVIFMIKTFTRCGICSLISKTIKQRARGNCKKRLKIPKGGNQRLSIEERNTIY